jgi:hypothetical protein
VIGQGSGGTDPVLLLQELYDGFRAEEQHRPDAVRSTVTLTPDTLVPDGVSTSLMRIELLDLDDDPIGVPLSAFSVEQAPGSDEVTTIGSPVDLGGGVYESAIQSGTIAGVDRIRVTADDGERPVVLMPDKRLPVGVPGEVKNVRWSSRVRMDWDAAAGAISYHIYRGDLDESSCGYTGECRDAFDLDRTDLKLTDLSQPAPGAGFFYLVTSVDVEGSEGILGMSNCGIRASSDPCP